jgi:AcrR family transcriptional regulator
VSSTTADATPGPASRRTPATTFGDDRSPTDDESAATEQAILDAGAAAIRRFGIRRTSMKEVARLAGVSRGSVYRYFPDKDALIAAVLSRNDAHFMAACNQAVDGLTTLGDKLATMAVWIRDQATGQLFMNLDETEPETVALMLTTHARPMLDRWIEFWPPHIEAAQRAGEIRSDLDPRQTAEWIVRSMLSLATTESVTFTADDPEQLRAFVATYLAAGLR